MFCTLFLKFSALVLAPVDIFVHQAAESMATLVEALSDMIRVLAEGAVTQPTGAAEQKTVAVAQHSCPIYLEAQTNVGVFPCGHLFCTDCARRM
jgi:predicted ArsR family transcriptional regulator